MGAITYPASNAVHAPAASQPRQPQNLQDLLRYSVEAATSGEQSSTTVPTRQTMDEEVTFWVHENMVFSVKDGI